ncbi:MAG: hypothetical protein RL514_239 [Verrucomicrobiota bacterium]|jgi:subtilisin-like proprotein convertase family protein/sugar lactone lactonase YvrE
MKSRYWFLLSLLLLVAAGWFWHLGEQRRLRDQPAPGGTNAPAQVSALERFLRLPSVLTGRPVPREVKVASPKPPELLSLTSDPRFPFRLRNSQKPLTELFASETAVLLRNAFVETLEPTHLNIPAHLRSAGEPGSYVVQARGLIDANFRAVLRGAGAEIVSYVPNNAYLVRGSAALAQQLRTSPRIQSVLPFEPYYKLDQQLLPLAVRQEALPAGRWLNLVLFTGTEEKALAELQSLGAEVKGEQRFPFGHIVTIAPPADSLVALAQMPAVQNIEAYQRPVMLNDLSRVRLDVSTNTTDTAPAGNWLGLRGNNVFVAVVGSGVDTGHPQLAGRTFLNAASPLTDTNGHETFMAGVIAALDSTAPNPVNGSIAGASYRGIAPGAVIYPLSLYDTNFTTLGHEFLITNAATATNIFIVNNSWGYPTPAYDIYSAIYDAAVRDGNPSRTNDQPMMHVFAAGNIGAGNSGGLGGAADSIVSPATLKNGITVGATEQFRLVSSTNDPLSASRSDSDSQVLDISSRGNVGVGLEGPAGRVKPDLVAPGGYDVSLRSATFTNITDADNQLGSSQFRYESGTSVAAAKVSGLLALMQEFFSVNYSRTNKPALNKALLINRARTASLAYDTAVNNLVSHQGWGMPSLSNTLPTAAAFRFLTNTATPVTARIVLVEESAYITNRLASGQFQGFNVTVPGSATSQTNTLRITLAWTDPPGNPVSSVKLVNDLDLYVTNLPPAAPPGQLGRQFEGNNIAPGTTISQPTSPGSQSERDSVNNVENTFILLTNTAVSTFRVYVIGRKVNVNAVSAETNNVVQDYSLVISTDDPTRSVTVGALGAVPFAGYTNLLVKDVTNGIPYLNERVGANSGIRALNAAGSVNTNGVTNQWNFYKFTNLNYAASTATNMITNIVAGLTNISTNVVRLPIQNGGPFVSFATFLPPNLARARNQEADIDLYMTRSSSAYGAVNFGALTNLDERITSHANTLRSTNRGGYELIALTNSSIGEEFIIGIKSEDQQGGSYGFFAAATQQPFSTNGPTGSNYITFFPVPMEIPDGTPDAPAGVTLYGISTTNMLIRSLTMSNVITHENLGDLVVTLTHNGRSVTLNNHTISPAAAPAGGGLITNNLVADDFRNPPDGPGDVTDFLGDDAVGLWILEIYDNAPFMTGSVDYAQLYITPFTNYVSTNTGVLYRTVDLVAGQSFVDFLDVPVYATNLDIDIVGGLPPGPAAPGQGVEIYASSFGVPAAGGGPSVASAVDLDSTDLILPHLRISPTTTPPLTAGRWNTRIVNNSSSLLTLTIRYTLSYDLSVAEVNFYRSNTVAPLLDDYTTNFFQAIPDNRVIAGVEVGFSIQHPRISDLRVSVVSPAGTRALLLENRGGTNGLLTQNFFGNFTENTNFTTSLDIDGAGTSPFLHLNYLLPVKFVPAPYSSVISPPRLMTNMTNTAFGHSQLPFGFSPQESPGGIAILGQQLVMAGKVNRNGINDGFLASYQIPITNNLDTTNWAVTNFWAGPFSGYRGANPSLPAVSRPLEQTFFNGVAVSVAGVASVGQTRNWTPPVLHTWSGGNTRQTYDVDLGCTSGTIVFSYANTDAADRMVVEYQGLTLLDNTTATAYTTTLTFSGTSRFVRVTANPTPAAAGSTWANALVVYRGNGVSYGVTNFLPFASGSLVWPPATPPAGSTTLSQPRGVALDSTGNVYVADSGNKRIIRFSQAMTLLNPTAVPNAAGTNGTVVPFAGGASAIDTDLAGLLLNSPGGVAVDTNSGDIYVADTGKHQVHRYNSNGVPQFTWGALNSAGSENSVPGPFPNGRLNGPQGLCVDSLGVVYVADTGNNVIRQISGTTMTTIATPAPIAPLNGPRGVIAVSPLSTLVIADTDNHRVVSIAAGIGSVFAGSGVAGTTDGIGVAAQFNQPSGITRDGYGNFYITDAGSHRVRRLTSVLEVQTIAGSVSGNVNDDVGTAARFDTPRGLVADSLGAVFVTEDSANNTVRLIAPYQTHTPTNSFLTILPFTGPPTNAQPVANPAIIVSRGITNDVFGLDLAGGAGTDSRDSFKGVTTTLENGTNFFYAVGDAQFSTNSVSGAASYNRMFVSKVGTNGQPIWSRGYQSTAVIHAVTNGAGAITSLALDYGGEGYTGVPVVTLHDPVAGTFPIVVTVAGGVVTGVPAFASAGPFNSPRVYVEAPLTLDIGGNAIAVAYGTNVISAGYRTVSTAPLTTNNVPFLMSLNPTNGATNWVASSPNGGHYNSISIGGTNLIAVGAGYFPGAVANSNCLIERWDLNGNLLNSVTYALGIGASALSGVTVVDALDRAYAVGTQDAGGGLVHAVMLELDLLTGAVLSAVTNDLQAGINIGKAIASDGGELYVATEGPADGNPNDRQAGLFRYRAKNYYLAEESLDVFVGESTWGTGALSNQWRLEITDTRQGGPVGPAQLISWNLNFSYAASNTVSLPVAPNLNNTFVLLAQPNYFAVSVPTLATAVTNFINASAPVRVTFNARGAPVPGAAGNQVVFTGSSGSFVLSTNSMVPGKKYYLAIEPLNAAANVNLAMQVDFAETEPVVPALTVGVGLNGFIPRTPSLSHYRFEVPANASAVLFELLNLTGEANLYVRRSNGPASLPSPAEYDYRSANPSALTEQIFVITNSASATALTPGTWFASVENADNGPVNFTLKATVATGLPYQLITAADAQPYAAVTSPGNAPNTVFRLPVTGASKALLFEVRALTGPGDLLVRRASPPLSTTYSAANIRAGRAGEAVAVRTNAGLPSLVGDWYFGVVNPGDTTIGYLVMARQPTNGVLLGSSPIQIVSPPGAGLRSSGTNFGFDLDAVPGERYQVQFSTTLHATNWQVLTNIVAPPGGIINFLHSGAFTNRNLYYRIQVVP